MDYEKILKAKKAGYSDEEIKTYLKKKGMDWTPLPKEVVNEPALQEITGPITDALTLGVGGVAGPAAKIAPQAIRAAEAIPAVAKTALNAAKGARNVVLAPTKKAGEKALGKALRKIELERGAEKAGEPRTGKAIIEFKESLKVNGKIPTPGQIKKAFVPQGIINKYDELGRILDHLRVANRGLAPKQIVAKGTIKELSRMKSKFGKAVKSLDPEIKKSMNALGDSYQRDAIMKAMGNLANPLWLAKKAMRGF